MSASNAFFWISIAYLVVLIGSAAGAVRLWLLNDAFELGAANRSARRTANMAVLTLAMIGAFASVVLFFLSQAINGESEARVAEANGAAREAQKQIAALNVELARITTPRQLNENQISSIALICSKYSNIPFELASTDGDPEARTFMVSIGNVLLRAGWRLDSWSGNTIKYPFSNGVYFGNTTNEGLVVSIHQDNEKKLMEPAQALASALNGLGMLSKVEVGDWKPLAAGGSDLSTDHIHILVGRK